MEHHHGHLAHLFPHIGILDWGSFVAVSWFSFLMSWHCGLMCGPLVCGRLTMPQETSGHRFFSIMLYNLGRLGSYILVGAFVGFISSKLREELSAWLPILGTLLTLSLALLLAWQGVLLFIGREWSFELGVAEKFLDVVVSGKQRNFLKMNDLLSSFSLGVLTVFLPCMTLSAAILSAASVEGGVKGAFILAGFCLGTMPMMFAMPLVSSSLASAVQSRVKSVPLKKISGLLLLIAAFLSSLRIL